jgi:predicted O-linked N-acetylglucosamine transferase (SPINDLY family)
LNDEEMAQLIRNDEIDILVDLTLHMAHSRLLVFARKPAPVQAAFAGYPGTTGMRTIDYRLSDRYLDPPGSGMGAYTEKTLYLPDSFFCYDPLTDEPAVSDLPAKDNNSITFGSLNNFCKVNSGVLLLWARVLAAVDRSRLVMLAEQGSHRQTVLGLLAQEGVEPDRVEFVTSRPRQEYLKIYHRIDIGLDTLPYNGHATSWDAFWMGVPVATLVGSTAVGRGGLSMLQNLGLPELVAWTPDEYVRVVVDLAGDLQRLAQLRAELRGRMQQSPLMDAPRFARGVETALRSMWVNYCQPGE